MRRLTGQGLAPEQIAWALDLPVADVAAGFTEPGSAAPRGRAVSAGIVRPNREPLPVSPRKAALAALSGRGMQRGTKLFLDGMPIQLRELVAAANHSGAHIPYPGLLPRPGAFHSGPSATKIDNRRRRIRITDISRHFPTITRSD